MLCAIITAAGKSHRFGSKKNLYKLNDEYVFVHSIMKMKHFGAKEIILVVCKEDFSDIKYILKKKNIDCKLIVGGDNRQKSVALGFRECTPDDDYVIIHDAARPFVSLKDMKKVLEKAKKHGAAILGYPVVDTIKQAQDDLILKTIDRNNLYVAQTPQIFKKTLYAKTSYIDSDITDDASLLQAHGTPVYIVNGSPTNIKITYKEDLLYAKFLAKEGYLCE